MNTRQTDTRAPRSMNLKTGLRAGITPIPIPFVLRPGTFVAFDGGGGINRFEGGGGIRPTGSTGG